jgi:hypothetical protein
MIIIMYAVKKEYVGKLTATVDGRTIELDENTPQEDLKLLAADVNAGGFIEELKASKPVTAAAALNDAKNE